MIDRKPKLIETDYADTLADRIRPYSEDAATTLEELAWERDALVEALITARGYMEGHTERDRVQVLDALQIVYGVGGE